MQTEAARRNGMVHTAALPPAPHGHPDVRGLETQVALRFALTKTASHGHQHRLPHRNGLITSPVVEVIGRRTEAAPSSSSGSSTRQGSVSELATSPTDSRISTPVDHVRHHSVPFISLHTPNLLQKQSDMEQRLANSLGRLRHRQLEITLTHSTSQLKHSALPSVASIERLSSSSLTSLPHSSPSWSPGLIVDTNDSSGVSSLDTSCMSSVVAESPLNVTSNVAGALSQHLASLEQTVDEELTCSSSDEEVEEETRSFRDNASARKADIKQRWERDRVKLGSQWAWLCHQVTSLNQQLRQVDAHFHSHPPKEAVQFATPGSVGFPCICGLPNGQGHDLLPKGNGSLLSSVHKPGAKQGGGNGSVPPCTCNLKKMLLSNPNLMGQQLQVRDILGYSFPVLLMDESTQTCARTRMLRRAPRRRILRKGKGSLSVCTSGGGMSLDPAHHPHLSQPTEYPSNLWLDTAINRVLQEHSYASIPLCKRRRPAVVLPPVESTPISLAPLLRMQRSKSFSPSPSPLDTPSDKSCKGLGPRKRMSSHIPYLDDDYHPSTPTLPLSARKKKGISTPSFDIDNIVIPYSMASSTRLEKLEYKEIITPKWREIEDTPIVRSKGAVLANGRDANSMEEEEERKPISEPVQPSRPRASRKLDLDEEATAQKPLSEEVEQEDLSEAVFNCRHLKCEESERKRYLNFITGNTRKRNRPQISTPDSTHPHPIPPDGEGMIVQVLPWPPRKFPLAGMDLGSLSNPLPPPKKIIRYIQLADRSHSASPSPLSHPLSTPSHLVSTAGTPPLHSASTAVTPLSSPVQIVSPGSNSPDAESPLSQWTVTTNTKDSKAVRHSNIVLKISRR